MYRRLRHSSSTQHFADPFSLWLLQLRGNHAATSKFRSSHGSSSSLLSSYAQLGYILSSSLRWQSSIPPLLVSSSRTKMSVRYLPCESTTTTTITSTPTFSGSNTEVDETSSAPPTCKASKRDFSSSSMSRELSSSSAILGSIEEEHANYEYEDDDHHVREAPATHLSEPPSSVIQDFVSQLRQAAMWKPLSSSTTATSSSNQQPIWDVSLCRQLVQQYEQYLTMQLLLLRRSKAEHQLRQQPQPSAQQQLLLDSDTVILALKVLLKSQFVHADLVDKLRLWEKALGELNVTQFTDHLSLRLLTANAKAGQVHRVLSLLQLRQQRNYKPRVREFELAVTAIRVAQSQSSSNCRNIFLPDVAHTSQSTTQLSQSLVNHLPLDNPTRWLDAILINMYQRNMRLTSQLASQMIQCYASGYTGKAVHHFYRVVRRPIITEHVDSDVDDDDDEGDSEIHYQGMPRQYYYRDGVYKEHPIRVQIEYHKTAPPYYKIPSQVGQQQLRYHKVPRGQTKLQQECDIQFSPALAAAFAFADSLRLGVAHHKPLKLDAQCYNALIQVCIQRGALWRAKHVLDIMIQQSNNVDHEAGDCSPDICSYNLFLVGLARVGDVHTMQEYTTKLISTSKLTPDAFTVRAIVNGLLNLGDMSGAVTVVQDFFNQHSVLPPYTTHLKIFELCLAHDMVYEAKRHLYFVQQLWKWQSNPYHSTSFVQLMQATQRNTQLQRPALERLFAYFGVPLDDHDFF